MGIDAQIKRAGRKRRRWRTVEQRKDVKGAELGEVLAEVRKEKRHKRSVRQKLLRFIKHPGWTQAQRDFRAEQLADQIEDLEAQEDRLVERIDELASEEDHAKHLKAFYADRLKRLRERRRRINATKGDLSPNFSRAEFDCRNGTPVPDAAIPALKALCEDVLEPQRARFGSIHINSGYRTASYNAAIGGASNSIHIYDQHPNAVAADHMGATGNARNWFDNTAGKASGRGLYATFHHADNRARIGWPWSTWSG